MSNRTREFFKKLGSRVLPRGGGQLMNLRDCDLRHLLICSLGFSQNTIVVIS